MPPTMSTTDHEASTEQDRNGVQVIRRAAQILNALKDTPNGLSLAQIAERTGLARSTVHRLVGALQNEDLVVGASPNSRFQLGPQIAILAAASERNFVLELHPWMAQPARKLDEAVDLAILEHDHVRFVHQIAATQRLRAVSSVGALFPAYCTANGKALLALLPEERVKRLLPETFEQLTPNTLRTRAELLEELREIRESGVAYDREEHTVGIAAVGVTFPDVGGQAVAMTVPVPALRFYGREETIAQALFSARREFYRQRNAKA